MTALTRRELFAATAATVVAGSATAQAPPAPSPSLCVFSKHLAFLDYPALARTLAGLRAHCDLSVRPGGHVLPENVGQDLRRAHAALAEQGVGLPMITTGLLSAEDPAARPTLETAKALGIPIFKLGFYRYSDPAAYAQTLQDVGRRMNSLAALAKEINIPASYAIHSANYLGAPMWDLAELIEGLESGPMGCCFDPYHAVIEGGLAGWQLGFHRLAPHINMVSVKDFYWEKRGDRWRVHDCPLGEGMVDFPKFFEMLAATGFNGPITLHQEFELEGPTEAIRQERTLAAIEKDVEYLRQHINTAFGPIV